MTIVASQSVSVVVVAEDDDDEEEDGVSSLCSVVGRSPYGRNECF